MRTRITRKGLRDSRYVIHWKNTFPYARTLGNKVYHQGCEYKERNENDRERVKHLLRTPPFEFSEISCSSYNRETTPFRLEHNDYDDDKREDNIEPKQIVHRNI